MLVKCMLFLLKRLFIFFGGLWVVLAMSMQILQRLAFGFDQDVYQPYLLFLIIQGIALVLMNSIYLAVVINHATQCELIIFYVNELRTRLEEKSITLKDAMQQILDIRLSIGSLNSTVSKMTSLVALTFLEKFIIGKIFCFNYRNSLRIVLLFYFAIRCDNIIDEQKYSYVHLDLPWILLFFLVHNFCFHYNPGK
jgi:hypothetical protein